MTNGVSTTILDRLIEAALKRQNYNHERLGREAQRYALRLSRAKAPELPEDLHDEVFQQAFVELFKLNIAALEDRSGRILFRGAVLAAIRVVRAAYAPPGQRTRTEQKLATRKVAAEDIGRIADTPTVERCSVLDGNFSYLDFDRLRDRRQETVMRQVEDRIDAEKLLSHAPSDVARALRLIHLDGEPVEDVAAVVRMSRFSLNRRISAFCMEWRAAA